MIRNYTMLGLLILVSCVLIVSGTPFISYAGETVTLTWDAPTTNADGSTLTDLAGYKVYRATASGTYTQSIADVGNVRKYEFEIPHKPRGKKYYYVVTAYDTSGNESAFSNEISNQNPNTVGGVHGSGSFQ